MKPTKSLVAISLCAGMAFSAFAGTAHNPCEQIRHQCMSNKMSHATCERRMEQCHHQMASRHARQVQMGNAQQNTQAATQQNMQPAAQQANPAAAAGAASATGATSATQTH